MTIIVFRKENERLASACMEKFKTPNTAKKHIEEDVVFFCSKHRGAIDFGWCKPHTLDYRMVLLKNGIKAYWQYFTI